LKRFFFAFDMETELGIPRPFRQYTRDTLEESDTVIQAVAFHTGAGNFPLTPEFMLGHRLGIHTDGKTDHFSSLKLTYPLGIKRFLAVKHETKWTPDQGIDNSSTDMSYMQLSLGRKFSYFGIISSAFQYSKSNIYQNKLGTAGIYRPVPIGYIDKYIDSIQTGDQFRYYRSISDTVQVPIDGPLLYKYWSTQPGLTLVTVPEYDIAIALSSTFQISLPLKMKLSFMQSIQGIWFPKKLQWYSFDAVNRNDSNLKDDINKTYDYNNYAIVYNAADGKSYLNTGRGGQHYSNGSLKEISIINHSKTRMDCNISLSVGLEKEFNNIGKLFCATTFLKSFSTLTKDDPVVILNYYWEMRAGWKKDISFTR
jgi:hypothetical protein